MMSANVRDAKSECSQLLGQDAPVRGVVVHHQHVQSLHRGDRLHRAVAVAHGDIQLEREEER
jgi:hypothetical protein